MRSAARASAKPRCAGSSGSKPAPAPRIALLVGGTSGQYRLDAEVASRLGQDVQRFAKQVGGSLFVTTSRRLAPAAADALCSALTDAAFIHRWKPDDTDNPYLGFLALADAIVITGDSESMLAEATAHGRPLYVYPLPERASFRLLRALRERVVARALALPQNRRGTPRPQRGLEYLCARAIERGFVRPTRDLGLLHEALYRRGVAKPFGAPFATDHGRAAPGARDGGRPRTRSDGRRLSRHMSASPPGPVAAARFTALVLGGQPWRRRRRPRRRARRAAPRPDSRARHSDARAGDPHAARRAEHRRHRREHRRPRRRWTG